MTETVDVVTKQGLAEAQAQLTDNLQSASALYQDAVNTAEQAHDALGNAQALANVVVGIQGEVSAAPLMVDGVAVGGSSLVLGQGAPLIVNTSAAPLLVDGVAVPGVTLTLGGA